MTPLVTVLIGAYDNAGTIRQAVDSILGQTVADLELIVLDDGSTDDTGTVVRGVEDERVRYLQLEHMGIARSLNLGIEEAGSAYVAVQDADDWSEPQRLERQLEVLQRQPDVAVPRTGHGVGDVDALLMRYNPLPNSCAAYRREAVLAVGGYDPRYRYAAEYDLWLRLADTHRIVVLDEVLATRRMSRTNVAGREERAPIAETITLRLAAMRRRRSLRGAHWLLPPAISFLTPTRLKQARRRRLGQAP
jgi:glycosyltransferase involved in cell wall biosynthesis